MRAFSPIVLAIALSGCTTYPLGLDEESWRELSPQQKLEASQKQAELDQARNLRLAREAEARAEEAREAANKLMLLRHQAKYGERVQCVLEPVSHHRSGKWRRLEPAALDLVLGVRMKVDLYETGRSSRAREAIAWFDGQRVQICPGEYAARHQPEACVVAVGHYRDYRRGMLRQIDSDGFLKGELDCSFVGREPY
ncbi:hypothetical protein [Marinobacterium sediminicola]|uniref:Uncharacterized protein n=1 Tax=Marinobacterium sediminicola TaxID=518898 RepID=A0ABY1RY54_9GAMM|nr:hypothetical protein [Marinobacterium sediminicola]ULG68692.1 hypothetical protein LN244_13460 [Marinobacterium sediminicola]SMR73216.1 hypothetical protein SAMN04487964_103157 [Marinobacterium sediminicola]